MTTAQVGFGALKKVMDEAKTRGEFSGSPYLRTFSWDDNEVKVLRFLSDEVITAKFYNFVITVEGNTRNFLINGEPGGPTDWVAKYASPTPGPGWQQDWASKQPVERKVAKRTAAVAVLRKRTANPSGHGFLVEDDFEQKEIGGKQLWLRSYGLVIQSHDNFWKSLLGYFNIYGTICDRDYLISRAGKDKNTEYTIVPLDPVPELADPAVVANYYGYGKPWPTNPYRDAAGNTIAQPDPALIEPWDQRFLYCPQTALEWADQMGSEERARDMLVPKAAEQPAAPAYGMPTPPGMTPPVAPPGMPTAPVMSTATGAPVVHQQPVPAPPVAPVIPSAAPVAPPVPQPPAPAPAAVAPPAPPVPPVPTMAPPPLTPQGQAVLDSMTPEQRAAAEQHLAQPAFQPTPPGQPVFVKDTSDEAQAAPPAPVPAPPVVAAPAAPVAAAAATDFPSLRDRLMPHVQAAAN